MIVTGVNPKECHIITSQLLYSIVHINCWSMCDVWLTCVNHMINQSTPIQNSTVKLLYGVTTLADYLNLKWQHTCITSTKLMRLLLLSVNSSLHMFSKINTEYIYNVNSRVT